MKEIKRVETPDEAILIKSQLESSGIDCFLKDNEIVSVYSLYSNAVGGIKILVPDESETEARELLDSEPLKVYEKHCPHCDSQNIKYRRFGLLNGVCIFSGFCLPEDKTTLFCQDCKMKFKESEMKIVDVLTLPDFLELKNEAESQLLNDIQERELPDYFDLVRYAFYSLLSMLALTPVYYFKHEKLPSEEHFIWGVFAGVLIGILMRYSTQIRKSEQ